LTGSRRRAIGDRAGSVFGESRMARRRAGWKLERVTTEAAQSTRMCELAARAGRAEVCTEDCPLFENGACSLEAVLEPDASPDDDAWAEDL